MWWDGLLEDTQEGVGLSAYGHGHGQMLHPSLDLTLKQNKKTWFISKFNRKASEEWNMFSLTYLSDEVFPELNLLQEEGLDCLLVPEIWHGERYAPRARP